MTFIYFKMPEKVVTKLLKDALPDNVVVSKDAKNAACRSASIFILQLSIAAVEIAQENRRRTLENQDIIKAATDLGLGEHAPQLVRFGAQRKRNAKRKESNMNKTKNQQTPNKKLIVSDEQGQPEPINVTSSEEPPAESDSVCDQQVEENSQPED